MTTTRAVLTPLSAELPSTNFPQLLPIHSTERIMVLAFDAATDEACFWPCVAWQGLTGTLTAVITYVMASATANTVGFQIQVEAVSDGDATDLDAATSYDTANNSASTTVPSTAGFIDQISITLTNQDSIAAGDWVRFRLNRDADGSAITDSASGDAYVLSVEIRDAA